MQPDVSIFSGPFAEEIGLQFSGEFIKLYFEIVELSEDYMSTKVKYDKLVSEKGAAIMSDYKNVPFRPIHINSLLRGFKQHHFTEVFFW